MVPISPASGCSSVRTAPSVRRLRPEISGRGAFEAVRDGRNTSKLFIFNDCVILTRFFNICVSRSDSRSSWVLTGNPLTVIFPRHRDSLAYDAQSSRRDIGRPGRCRDAARPSCGASFSSHALP
jgi:hypothetical protein